MTESNPIDPETSSAEVDRAVRAIGVSVFARLQHIADGALESISLAGPADAATRPHRAAHYQVQGEIGRGGMGIVYSCHDEDLRRDVAMKVMQRDTLRSPAVAQRFVAEAQITGQLQHPGVPPVYELGVDEEEQPYFTMKLVRGRTLSSLLEERPDPNHERRRYVAILAQVSQTVAYAHARGVIHRDLKPSNVMVGAFGEVQVMDWGLAKVVGAEGLHGLEEGGVETDRSEDASGSSDSLTGSILGTPAYMPPEQARGEVSALDARSDVFSLGATLCAVLTGSPPYAGDHRQRLRAAEEADLERARQRLATCGAEAELVALAVECLSPDPAERPADAGVVADRLNAHLASAEERLRAAEMVAAEARGRAVEERRRRRLTVALAVTILLAVVAAFAGQSWLRSQRREEATMLLSSALSDAVRLQGEARASGLDSSAEWSVAVDAAQRVGLLVSGAADDDLARHAADCIAALEIEAEQASKDRRMAARLEAIRLEHEGGYFLGQQVRAFEAAFGDYGVAVGGADPQQVARQVRESAITEQLVLALDAWALGLQTEPQPDPASWPVPAKAAAAADQDPWRHRIRLASLAGDLDQLRSIAAEDHRAQERSPWSLDMLARRIASAGDATLAISVLTRAVLSHPGDFWLHHDLSAILATAPDADPELAYSHALAARAIRPGEGTHMLMDLAARNLDLGHRERAKTLYEEAIARAPQHADALLGLGIVLEEQDDVAGALDCFARALAIEESAEVYYHRGRLFQLRGNLGEAVTAYERALELDPNHSSTCNNLGTVLRDLGQVERAITVLRELIARDPEYRLARYNLGRALTSAGLLEEAVAAYEESVLVYPDHALGHNNLGNARRRLGDLEGARAAYLDALRIDPELAIGHNNLGVVLKMLGDQAGAIREYRAAIRLRPAYSGAHENLGYALEETGDLAGAANAFGEAARLDPKRVASECNHGRILMALDRPAEALPALERCHELGSRDPSWSEPSGDWVTECQRRIEELRSLEAIQAGEPAPANAVDCLELAALAHQQGQHVLSSDLYQAAFALPAASMDGDRGRHLLDAARAATVAGGAEHRARALRWLSAELDTLAGEVQNADAESAAGIHERLSSWLTDPGLAGLRETVSLAELPATERRAVLALWDEVYRVLDLRDSRE